MTNTFGGPLSQGAGQLRPYQQRRCATGSWLVGAQLACALATLPPNRHPGCFTALRMTRERVFLRHARNVFSSISLAQKPARVQDALRVPARFELLHDIQRLRSVAPPL